MAAYDLEEQEQIAEIKAWWKQYGNRLVNAATVIALLVLAWQGWNWYQRNQSTQASMIYSVLQKAAQDNDTQKVKAASGELLEKFGRTAYAEMGALVSAKAMADSGDVQTAKAQLVWAVEHATNELRDLARLRLAALLLDEKAYDEALKQLEGASGLAFEVRFLDMRGDVLAAQGKKAEAVAAYQTALAKQEELIKSGKSGAVGQEWQGRANAVARELINQKIDALGGAK
jgi:predicted negative regulator of RcsB-dependent stress response